MACQETSPTFEDRIKKDESLCKDLLSLCRNLQKQALANVEYFEQGKGTNNIRFYESFKRLHEHLTQGIEDGVIYLLSIAHHYDYGPNVPANGYRSMVNVTQKCCAHLLQLTRHISVTKDSILFRAGHYSKELEAYTNVLGQLRACLFYLQKLPQYCAKGCLFGDEKHEESSIAQKLMMEVELLSQEPFYGRCLGFQYCESMRGPLQTITLVMASYSDGFENNSAVMRLANTLVGGSKYMMDPELKAQKIASVTRTKDISFLNSFWNIVENDLMHKLPLFICPPVAVDKVVVLYPEDLVVDSADGSERLKISPPCAHSGLAPVFTRLISHQIREGQEELMKSDKVPSNKEPLSPGLIIHCHGGGFVAQSSASHEIYLRSWAKDVGVPIFSIDYSLAPEHPFPRQLEEAFYAYIWALKNCRMLGSTGERIVVAGDSAGANLVTAMCLRAAAFGVRVPDGILSVYGCMLIQYLPSPSRIMALMDPLLPIGVLSQVLAAYAGVTSEYNSLANSSQRHQDCQTDQSGTSGMKQTVTLHGRDSLTGNQAVTQPEPMEVGQEVTEGQDTELGQVSKVGEDVTKVGQSALEYVQANSSILVFDESSNDSGASFESCDPDSSIAGVHLPMKGHHPSLSQDSGIRDFLEQSEKDKSDEMTIEGPASSSQTLQFSSDTSVVSSVGGLTSSPADSSIDQKSEKCGIILRLGSIEEDDDQSQNMDSLVKKIKDGADELDSRQAGTQTKDLRSRLTLNLDPRRLFWSRTKSDAIMTKSPSMPAFSTTQSSISPKAPEIPRFGNMLTPPYESCSPPTYAQIRHFVQSPVSTFLQLPIPGNVFMSPYLATDDLLMKLPHMSFVALQLDPMLDDSVMFAKRLRSLDKEVTLDVISDLPHGFLNFVLVSKDAKIGSDLCVQRLRELLNIGDK